MQLILKDSEWLRGDYAVQGDGLPSSFLRRVDDGRMCCLGIHAVSCGIPTEMINYVDSPGTLCTRLQDEPGVLRSESAEVRDAAHEYVALWLKPPLPNHVQRAHTHDATTLMELNDSRDMDDEERVERMRPIFEKHGITLDFRPEE